MFKHLSSLLLCLPLFACGEKRLYAPLADFEVPALRNVMFEIDTLNWSIEPLLRVPNQAETVASSARSMQRWANDPAWLAYYDEPGFLGDRARFDLYLGWLRAGLEDVASSAEKGDIDGVRRGFILAQQSCTACHKRFNPNL